MDEVSYREGFEDCAELCMAEVNEAESLGEARKRISDVLFLIKEDKLERIKQRLYMIRP